jgi:hypothetical protein
MINSYAGSVLSLLGVPTDAPEFDGQAAPDGR